MEMKNSMRVALGLATTAGIFGLAIVGAAHLIVLTARRGDPFFLLRIVLFTICLGLLAGYYQEKYNNHASAIMVHMAGNFLAIIASFSMQQA